MNNSDFIGLAEEYATNDQLTMQVGDIVRCEDCKHVSYVEDAPIEYVCLPRDIAVRPQWFCADGERKDNE